MRDAGCGMRPPRGEKPSSPRSFRLSPLASRLSALPHPASLRRHLDLPGDDVALDLFEARVHTVRDQRFVVLIVDVAYAMLGEAVVEDPALERPILRAADL